MATLAALSQVYDSLSATLPAAPIAYVPARVTYSGNETRFRQYGRDFSLCWRIFYADAVVLGEMTLNNAPLPEPFTVSAGRQPATQADSAAPRFRDHSAYQTGNATGNLSAVVTHGKNYPAHISNHDAPRRPGTARLWSGYYTYLGKWQSQTARMLSPALFRSMSTESATSQLKRGNHGLDSGFNQALKILMKGRSAYLPIMPSVSGSPDCWILVQTAASLR